MAGVALVVACAAGCGGPGRYSIRVTLDPALKDQTVEVNVVGVNESESSVWKSHSMTSYWTPQDALRKNAVKRVMTFAQGLDAVQILPRKDPKKLVLDRDSKKDATWQDWEERGAQHLFVLASLPGTFADQPGDADPRRLILPLDKSLWGGKRTIDIVIKPSHIVCLTKHKPEKK